MIWRQIRMIRFGLAAPLVLRLAICSLTTLGLAVPAAAADPASAGANAPAGPRAMALGLAGVEDWSVQQPFIDVMKSARTWIGHRPGQWGGQGEHDLIAQGILDPDGWPKVIPTSLRGIGTVVLTDLPETALSLAGRYRLKFDGEGIVEVSGRATRIRYAPGEVRFDFTPGPGPVIVTIKRTDRRKTGDHVRNISIVKLDNLERYNAGEVFNPDWIARIKGFGTVRLMDWMNTNETLLSDWSDRPRPDDYTFTGGGVPIEIMVQLANTLDANPWFTMPHRATDSYIKSFAEYVRDALDPALISYVEYSNEVWNWHFPQSVWVEQQAQARWGVEYAWMQYYGLRSAQMAEIWKQAFGTAAATRLVTVISTQTGWLGLEQDVLHAPRWVDEAPGSNLPPADQVDAYAVSGYFGGILGTPEWAPTVREWLAESRTKAERQADNQGLEGAARADYVAARKFDTAIEIAARQLRDGSVTGDPTDSLADLIGTTFAYHADVAQSHGLELIMYEGGSHVAGVADVVDDDELTEFFVALNYTPQMGALYTELLNGWRNAGGRLFNVFVDVVQPGKWGSWGALRDLGDQNPRWDALIGFN